MKFALSLLSAITLAFASEPTINSRITGLSSRANGLAPTVDPTTYVPVSGGGGTYPRLAQLADGSVLATTTTFSGATHILTVTRSTDGARTFSAWGTVSTGTGDLDNLFVKQLANGDILATFRNHDKNSAGAYTIYRITACISHDNGKTWAFLSQVDTRTATTVNNGLWEPFIRIAKSGAIQAYYAAENSAADQDILMRSSTNGGTTWSAATTAAGATTTGRDGMPGCTDFTSGGTARVLCIFETTEGTAPTFTVKSVVSTNDGVSFGERRQVYVPTGSGNNAGAPQVVTTTGGTLVASFMTDEDTSAHIWPNGGSMKILTSLSSDPAVWGQKTTVLPVTSVWPGIFARSDGSNTAVGCADNSGAKCHEISFA